MTLSENSGETRLLRQLKTNLKMTKIPKLVRTEKVVFSQDITVMPSHRFLVHDFIACLYIES